MSVATRDDRALRETDGWSEHLSRLKIVRQRRVHGCLRVAVGLEMCLRTPYMKGRGRFKTFRQGIRSEVWTDLVAAAV
jgi:hypothetical protein